MRRLIIVMAMLGFAHSAHAHGIAGNRLFPGTLAFDDPAVADESILPLFSSSKQPDEGGDVVDKRFTWSIFRLLTPTLGVGVDSGWVHRDWGTSQRSGFDTTNLTVKGEIYRNDLHETLVSSGLTWGIGHSGAQGVGANAPDFIAPGIFFGKGFGDLPASLAWLRPFGITGALTFEHPMTGTSINSGIDPVTGQLGPTFTRNVDTLHWGFALEFSTLYLTSRFTPGKLPKEEPLNQLVPLVEFSFVSPRGEKTAATMNPRAIVRGGDLASGGRGDRATQQRSRTVRRCQGATAFVSRRSNTVAVWKTALESLITVEDCDSPFLSPAP
jgi:hypothetical protein